MDSKDKARLRREVKQRLDKTLPSAEQGALNPEELIEELKTHQIELELQNGELRSSQTEIDSLQEKYFDLFDTAPAGYLILDEHGSILEANLTAADMLGVERRHLVGTPFFHFIDPNNQALYASYFEKIIADDTKTTAQMWFRKSDNADFYAALDGIVVTHHQKRAVRLIFTDITDQIRAQKAAKESEAKFRFLYENSPTLTLVVSPGGIIIDVNPHTLQTLGYARDEVVGKKAQDFVAFEHVEQVGRTFQQALAGRLTEAREIIVLAKDGTPCVILFATGSELIRKDGAVQGILFTGIDVTTQRKAEKALQNQQACAFNRLQKLVQVSRQVIGETAIGGLVTCVVDAVRSMTGARMATCGYGYGDGQFVAGATSKAPEIPPCPSGKEFVIEHGGVFLDLIGQISPLRLTDEQLHAHLRRQKLPENHTSLRGLLGVPLTGIDEKPNGFIMVSDKEGNAEFTAEDESLLVQLATLASLGLHHIHAKEEARHKADELDAVFKSLAQAAMITNHEGRVTMVNPAHVELHGFDMTGMSRDDLSRKVHGTTCSMRYPDGSPVPFEDIPSLRALNGKTVQHERFLFTNSRNEELYVSVSSSPIETNGRIVGTASSIVDLTADQEKLGQILSEQAKLKAVIDNAPVAIVVVDEHCRITMTNALADSLYQRPIPYGKDVDSHAQFELCYSDGTPYDVHDLPLTRSVFQGERYANHEMLIVWPDGQKRSLLVNTTPITDADGIITGAVAAFQDITEQKAQQKELHRSKEELELRVQERTLDLVNANKLLKREITQRIDAERELTRQKEILERIFENIPVMLCFYNTSGEVSFVNRAFETTLGWVREEVKLTDIMEVCYPDPVYRQEVWSFMMEAKPGWRDFKLHKQDGTVLDTTWANESLSDGSRIGIGIDVSERKQVERDLRASEEMLHELSVRLFNAQEDERKFIALELHDTIAASLSAIKMKLQSLVKKPPVSPETLDSVVCLVDKTNQEVRRIMGNLRPAMLDDLGLIPTIRYHCREFQELYPHIVLKPIIELAEEHIPASLKIVIFRVLQEASNNIGKHSKAGQARIRLAMDSNGLVLEIADNGKGFDPDALSGQSGARGIGLSSMQERTWLSGGTFTIESVPGKGTTVRALWPVESGDGSQDSED